MGDQVRSHCFKVIRWISKKSKKIKNYKKLIFFEKNHFFKITDGIAVPTAHHGRRPIAVPTAIWSLPMPA
jgi:hypothetical protein